MVLRTISSEICVRIVLILIYTEINVRMILSTFYTVVYVRIILQTIYTNLHKGKLYCAWFTKKCTQECFFKQFTEIYVIIVLLLIYTEISLCLCFMIEAKCVYKIKHSRVTAVFRGSVQNVFVETLKEINLMLEILLFKCSA